MPFPMQARCTTDRTFCNALTSLGLHPIYWLIFMYLSCLISMRDRTFQSCQQLSSILHSPNDIHGLAVSKETEAAYLHEPNKGERYFRYSYYNSYRASLKVNAIQRSLSIHRAILSATHLCCLRSDNGLSWPRHCNLCKGPYEDDQTLAIVTIL